MPEDYNGERGIQMTESQRLRSVQKPIIPVIGELIRQNPGTISLGQGVVWYPPPPQVAARVDAFPTDPLLHKYQSVYGIPELVTAIERKLADENRIEVGPESRIFVTAGGNMAFINALLAIVDPGDEVILNVPYYFNHEMAIVMASCRPVLVPTDERYQLQPELIEAAITPRTRAVVTVSPNNPTGMVYPEAALREVNRICREQRIYHIHDEAYEYFTYGEARHFSPGSIAGSQSYTISLFSLSKSYGFASWRIGYQVVPAHLFEAINKVQDTVLICPPVVSQYAAVGAMEAGSGYCRAKLPDLDAVRQLALEALRGLGDRCVAPASDGAFYFLLRLQTDQTAMAVVERLVREHKVAAIPGTAFGIEDGCYLRVSYGALQRETVVEGLGRLISGLKAIL
ncbi:MAG: pyridoxal phosphate-dependent aminotransferase [Acidobacteriota bacterium]